jgi:putative transposase
MGFVHDQLFDGRPFRMLTVIDQFSRQSPLVESRFSFSGRDVVAALDRLIGRAGTPVSITVDRGTEFTSKALEEWAYRVGVKLDFTHPGKPTENGHIESFNGRLRDECLTSISSYQWGMQQIRSTHGERITIITDPIAHSAI